MPFRPRTASLVESHQSDKTSLMLSHIAGPEVCGSSGSVASEGRCHHVSVRELTTTLTLEKAMAAPAVMGCKLQPHGRKKPIARGIPSTLYMHAHKRFRRMTRKMPRDKCNAATTSRRFGRIRTMSAASTATVVPDESAMPRDAATSAGESLMPSPTCDLLNTSALVDRKRSDRPLRHPHHPFPSVAPRP